MDIVEQSAGKLRSKILSGEWEPDARVPPERRLAEHLGVNRGTVRSALKVLQTEGLLEVRQGSGHRVRRLSEAAGPALIPSLLEDLLERDRRGAVVLVEDLLMVRRHLASGLLRILFRARRLELGPTRQALAHFLELAQAVGRDAAEPASEQLGLDKPVVGDIVGDIVEADLAIVAALASASGSIVLQLCLNPVAEVLRSTPGLAEAMFQNPLENHQRWTLLLELLESTAPGTVDASVEVQLLDMLATQDELTLQRFERSMT